MRPEPPSPSSPRLYHDGPLSTGAIVPLSESATRHAQALRLQRGDPVTLFNGDGHEYPADLAEFGKRGVSALVRGCREADRESPLAIRLAQGVCAADRMDLIIQKATELGVTSIAPVVTRRSIVRLSSERQERRETHWQNVAIAACEQCGRNRVPRVAPSIKFDEFIAALGPRVEAETRILLSPHAERSLKALPPAQAVLLAIGPEGGLEESERDLLASRGFVAVRMGPRVLRTETAPLAALAALQTLWGDG